MGRGLGPGRFGRSFSHDLALIATLYNIHEHKSDQYKVERCLAHCVNLVTEERQVRQVAPFTHQHDADQQKHKKVQVLRTFCCARGKRATCSAMTTIKMPDSTIASAMTQNTLVSAIADNTVSNENTIFMISIHISAETNRAFGAPVAIFAVQIMHNKHVENFLQKRCRSGKRRR